MPEASASQSNLYSATDQPALNGMRCCACGYVFFPPQNYGCESCGAAAEHLEPRSLKGEGLLSSFATVHLHQGKDIEAPFTVGVIVLDDGPAVRAILTKESNAGLKIGDRMRAVLIAAADDESGAPANELRFAKQENEQ
jgi:uncharacterized protein